MTGLDRGSAARAQVQVPAVHTLEQQSEAATHVVPGAKQQPVAALPPQQTEPATRHSS